MEEIKRSNNSLATATQVIETINKVKNMIRPKEEPLEIFDEKIKELKELVAILRKRENEFYKDISIKNDTKDPEKKLKDKLKKANDTYECLVSNNTFNKLINDQNIKKFLKYADIRQVTKGLSDLLNKMLNNNNKKLEGVLNDLGIAGLDINSITKLMGHNNRGGTIDIGGLIIKLTIGKDKNKNIDVTYKSKKGGGALMSSQMKYQIINIINTYLGEKNGLQLDPNKQKEDFIKAFFDFLGKNGISSNDVEYARNKVKAGQIALDPNPASIRGALGEIYGALFWRSIVGEENVKSTGTIRTIKAVEKGVGKGKEINIDMIVKGYGFQIKNYRENVEGRVDFYADGGRQPAGDYFKSVNDDIFSKLFAIYQYNQATTKGMSNKDNFKRYQKFYSNFENLIWSNQSSVLDPLIASHINDFLKISKKLIINEKTRDELFTKAYNREKDEFLNTFYIINGRLIPASKLVNSVINTLKKARLGAENGNNKIVRGSIGAPKRTGNMRYPMTTNGYVSEGDLDKDTVTNNLMAIANSVTIYPKIYIYLPTNLLSK